VNEILYKKKIEELEKENAELKKEIKKKDETIEKAKYKYGKAEIDDEILNYCRALTEEEKKDFVAKSRVEVAEILKRLR
jgi:hypothetical protein